MSQYQPEQASAREDLCRFLAACFYEPAQEFAQERLFASMSEAAQRIDPDLAARASALGEAFAAQDLPTLLLDYSRLFLGPVRPLAQPYGSVWLSGRTGLMQDSTLALLALYDQGGFAIDDDFCDLPDHVAVELEFLYLLIFTRNQALKAANRQDQAAGELLQKQFLAEHLGAWIGPFAAAVKAGAETAFYRELAEFAERFVRMEAGTPAVH